MTRTLPTEEEDCSIDVISQEKLNIKLLEMTMNAKQQIDAMASLAEMKTAYMNRPQKLIEKLLKTVKIRIITENRELDAFTKEILQLSQAYNNPIELRQLEELPFNLTIVDDKEATWGELPTKNENGPDFRINDPMQITILKTSFENL